MTRNPILIKRIRIVKLFGHLNYTIPENLSATTSRLMIIYGDNGSGKTTILQLLFYLISSKDLSGYKSKLAKVKFQTFEVELGNSLRIGAKRRGKQIVGSYDYYIKKGSKVLKTVHLKTNDDLTINLKAESPENIKFQEILNYIRGWNISIFYLSDDRKILNSLTSTENEPKRRDFIGFTDYEDFILPPDFEKGRLKGFGEKNKLQLEPAMERLLNWVRNKTISGSKTGEKNSQVIFADIFKSLNQTLKKGMVIKSKEELISDVVDIESQIKPFYNLGLIDNFESASIRASIKTATKDEQLNYINVLVTPFLDSIKAKLNALEKLQQTLTLFLKTINQYYTNKKVYFNLNEGFSLKHTNGEKLDFNWLSSGEKQLLLLLINTITSTDRATMFIIDEPEISLNIKWQRQLINTLLDFSNEKNIQFILATHSIELLSTNVESVTKLTHSND